MCIMGYFSRNVKSLMQQIVKVAKYEEKHNLNK